jgi:hypothetical protein
MIDLRRAGQGVKELKPVSVECVKPLSKTKNKNVTSYKMDLDYLP